MGQRNFPYSMKNIPDGTNKLYLKILLIKLNYLSNECNGKPFFFVFLSESTFKCGFKICNCPPEHKDLMEYEDDLQKMISYVQFRRVNNDFQNRLKNDIRSIQ